MCQLHSNNLVLMEVCRELGGKISGPGSFTGLLDKAASDPVHRLSPVKFRPVCGPELALPDSVVDISSDHQPTRQLTRAVQTGYIATKGACKRIGSAEPLKLGMLSTYFQFAN